MDRDSDYKGNEKKPTVPNMVGESYAMRAEARAAVVHAGTASLAIEATAGPQLVHDSSAPCQVRDLTICRGLPPEELNQLAAIVSQMALAPRKPLFHEGEPASSMFNVTAGTVKVYKLLPDGRRQVTGFLFAGDFLGLANSPTYAFSAEAVTAARVWRFSRRRIEELVERFPRIEHRLLGIAGEELASAQEQILLLGRKTARERIASFLLLLSRSAVRRGEPATPIAVPMSRSDIADFLGVTTETVSRIVTQLKRSGLIALLRGSRVELSDRQALEDLAQGFVGRVQRRTAISRARTAARAAPAR